VRILAIEPDRARAALQALAKMRPSINKHSREGRWPHWRRELDAHLSPPAPAYQQILKGVPAVDYGADELIYAPRNPRVHKAYGFSPVEQVQMSVNIALRRQIYQCADLSAGARARNSRVVSGWKSDANISVSGLSTRRTLLQPAESTI
jgi:phage portal protein BeeE